jgi:hypothetical protein
MSLQTENSVSEKEENSDLMAVLFIILIHSSCAICGMSAASNVKGDLTKGRVYFNIWEIY